MSAATAVPPRTERRIVAIVFAVAFALCALVTKPHAVSWNDASRLATIDALANHGTFAIDASPYAAVTRDEYRYGGSTYSDKPPALALAGAGVALVLAKLGITLTKTPATAIYLITLLTVGFWFALGAAYMYALQRLWGIAARTAAAVAALSALATLNLPYATVLSNHVPCGAAALAALYHLARVRESNRHAAAAGLFLTLAYAFDAAAVVFGVCALVMLWGAPRARVLVFAAACVPVVALQLAYNLLVSGALGPPAMNQASWADPSSPFHRAAPSMFHFSTPGEFARYLVYVTVGDKGLFSYTPLMAVALYGFARMRRAAPELRRAALAVLATAGLYVALIVGFTDDYGALNFGQRRYVDVFFVLCAGLGPALAAIRSPLGLALTRVAIVVSVAIAALGTVAPFAGAAGVPGYVFEPVEFANLARRAPVQAAIDVLAAAVMILLVLRLSSTRSVPTSGTDRPVA